MLRRPMRIVVCERATTNPDGTYSIVRGGLDRFDDPRLPFDLVVSLFVEATPEELPPGTHDLAVSGTAPNGIAVEGGGKAIVPANVDHVRAAVPFAIRVEAVGLVTIVVKFGTVEATTVITVGPAAQRPGAGSGN